MLQCDALHRAVLAMLYREPPTFLVMCASKYTLIEFNTLNVTPPAKNTTVAQDITSTAVSGRHNMIMCEDFEIT